ncbi:hypothetical protein KSC_076700 [Ktedonobacter sp. SOSP1-52]|uniref:hypothetical protein n=1 Tax=Ktedonobacter sp. SOSP1-52 TaxID=2778366 RepID=UPI001A2DF82F|nr:hypothetical protein [Ktedonobacter sp. SOSP1-52]GHO68778.1 hypothetical protein KSC_076700 [Ktedonobacter sp. SOSP1-52]
MALGEKAPDGQGAWGPGYPTSQDGKLYFFSMGQVTGNKWVEGLWILHDGKRDFYPLQD